MTPGPISPPIIPTIPQSLPKKPIKTGIQLPSVIIKPIVWS
jgi:hypothetical protein